MAGVAVVAIVGLVALAGIGFYAIARNFEIEGITRADADRRFREALARFPDREPLVELTDDGPAPRINRRRPQAASPPRAVHIMALDLNEDQLVTFQVPLWLLRLKAGGSIRISTEGETFELDEIPVTVEDLERFGPGIVLDQTIQGKRVLVWTE